MSQHLVCSRPEFHKLIVGYCLGTPTQPQPPGFDTHILECDVCLDAVQRVDQQVQTWRREGIVSDAVVAGMPELPRRFYVKREQ